MAHKGGEKKGMEAPGTLTLVLIFFAWFVFLYIISWAALGRVWPVQ